MLSTFRHIQKGTLIAVTILIVIAFAFLYSDFDFVRGTLGTTECVIRVNGRCYRVEEAQRLAQLQTLAFNLGMNEFANGLRGPHRTFDRDPTEFVLNLLVLRAEASRLGIEPSADEIKETIPTLRVFMDPRVDDEVIRRNLLGPLGLTESDLAELVRDYLAYTKIQDLVAAGVQPVPIHVDKTYIQQNQQFTASIVNFERQDFAEQVEISEEEIREYYDERQPDFSMPEDKEIAETSEPISGEVEEEPEPRPAVSDELMTAPRRGFDYVKFVPGEPGEEDSAEDQAKRKVEFAKKVNRIYAELASEDESFDEVAERHAAMEYPFAIEISALEPFKQDEAPDWLARKGDVLQALFSRTLLEGQVSVPFQSGDDGAYYVFRYSEEVEPRPMTYEEAKPLIVEALTARKSNQMADEAAREALDALKAAVEAGESIRDAASAKGFDLVTPEPFSERNPPKDDDPRQVLAAVRGTGPGEFSEVMARSGGKGYFFTLVERIELRRDEEKDGDLLLIGNYTERIERQNLFLAWLHQRARESGAERDNSVLNYRR